jgi:hypothetical protein
LRNVKASYDLASNGMLRDKHNECVHSEKWRANA